MKRTILTIILGLFLIIGLKAQTTVTIPTFENETVIMKIFVDNAKGAMVLTDGTVYFDTDLKTYSSDIKNEKAVSNQKLIASVMNQLRKQKYKLQTTSVETQFTEHFFQKE